MSKRQAARDMIVYMAILIEGGLVVVAILLGWYLEQHPLDHFTFDVWGIVWGVLGTVPMLGLFALLDRWPVGPLESLKQFTENTIRPMMAPCTLIDLLGISCLAGLGEEMLFRGLLQQALANQFPVWLAIWVSSVAFGIVHAVTPSYALIATLMGVYLGWLYVATGNLFAPIIAHGLYDFVVLVYVLRGPGAPEYVEDEVEDYGEEEEYEEP